MTAATTTPPAFACEHCGDEYEVARAGVELWRAHHPDDALTNDVDAMIRSTVGSTPGWITCGVDGEPVLVCPTCVAELGPEIALTAGSGCPEWCTSDHSSGWRCGSEWSIAHRGPDFGEISVVRWHWQGREQLDVELRESERTLEAKADWVDEVAFLRRLAADAAAAADWLEALRAAS